MRNDTFILGCHSHAAHVHLHRQTVSNKIYDLRVYRTLELMIQWSNNSQRMDTIYMTVLFIFVCLLFVVRFDRAAVTV